MAAEMPLHFCLVFMMLMKLSLRSSSLLGPARLKKVTSRPKMTYLQGTCKGHPKLVLSGVISMLSGVKVVLSGVKGNFLIFAKMVILAILVASRVLVHLLQLKNIKNASMSCG